MASYSNGLPAYINGATTTSGGTLSGFVMPPYIGKNSENKWDGGGLDLTNIGTMTVATRFTYRAPEFNLNTDKIDLTSTPAGMIVERQTPLTNYRCSFFEADDSWRIGVVGSEQHIMTRDASTSMSAGRPLMWDGSGYKAVTSDYDLTISGTSSINQALLTTSSPTFAGLNLNGNIIFPATSAPFLIGEVSDGLPYISMWGTTDTMYQKATTLQQETNSFTMQSMDGTHVFLTAVEDGNIIIRGGTDGSGEMTISGTGLGVSASTVGGTNTISCVNTDTTNGSSSARFLATGSHADSDAYMAFSIPDAGYSIGLDGNSSSIVFRSTSDFTGDIRLQINDTGSMNVGGHFGAGGVITAGETVTANGGIVVAATKTISMTDTGSIYGDGSMHVDASSGALYLTGPNGVIAREIFQVYDTVTNGSLIQLAYDKPNERGHISSYNSSAVAGTTTAINTGVNVDSITEYTADTGVTIEGILLKDNAITTGGSTEAIKIPMEITMMNPDQSPTWSSWGTSMYTLPFTVSDAVHFSTELPHSRKVDSAITPRVHMIVSDSTAPAEGDKIKWEMIYRIGNVGGAMGAEQTINGEYTAPAGLSSGDHIYVDLTAISGTSITSSANIIGRIKRVTASSAEYGQTISVSSLDLQITIDSIGK